MDDGPKLAVLEGPDGPLVVTVSRIGRPQCWDAETASPRGSPFGPEPDRILLDTGRIGAVPVVVTGTRTEVSCWDAATGTRTGGTVTGFTDTAMPELRDRSFLADLSVGQVAGVSVVATVALASSVVQVWDLGSGRELARTEGVHVGAGRLAVQSDLGEMPARLYTSDIVGAVFCWSLDGMGPQRRWRSRPARLRMLGNAEPGGQVDVLVAHPTRGVLVARGGVVEIRGNDLSLRTTVRLAAPVNGMAWADENSVVVTTEKGVVVLDVASEWRLRRLRRGL
jgi:hypothetical protein